MAFVLDASIALSWAFADEEHPHARLALERLARDSAIVPSLWLLEVRNVRIVNERRGRISEEHAAAFLLHVSRLRLLIDYTPNYDAALGLARKHRLTIYDAVYLELARREAIPLATLDRDLIAAAQAESVARLGAEQ